MGDDECAECMEAMPMTHYHYEEMEWDSLLDTSKRKTQVEEPKPKITRQKVSKTHSEPRVDGSDWTCDACGAVSGDFDLFEEVGMENACKPVPVSEAAPAEGGLAQKDTDELNDLYKKLLAELKATEAKRFRPHRTYTWPTGRGYLDWTSIGWTSTEGYTVKEEPVEETVSAKTYTELAKEFRAARENPENQKKWYSDVNAEIQRRERRR